MQARSKHRLKRLGIVGQTGQLARALKDYCDTHQIETVTLGRNSLDLSRDSKHIKNALLAYKDCDALINAAAYTAVDAAEEDEETALQVNSKAPEIFAQYCKQTHIPFVHISTDYVFDGKNQEPYETGHPTAPLGIYGATKLAGEEAIQKIGGQCAILRTSWVYDGVGKNFMTTMLRLAETRDTLNVVHDQKGRPTYAPDLAEASLVAIQALLNDQEGAVGIFHISNSGPVISWADFARAIFEIAKPYLENNITVYNIPSEDYPTPAKRPAYSGLNISKFEDVFRMRLPDWSSSLEHAISVWADSNR